MSATRTTPAGSGPVRDRPVGELLLAARRDPAALGELLQRFRGLLLAEAPAAGPPGFRPPFGDSALVQDALLLACRHFPEFRGTTGPELVRWLRAILHRVALSQARNEAHTRQPARADALAGRSPAAVPFEDLPDPSLLPPDEVVAARERDRVVRDVLAGLPEDHRSAVWLRFHDRLSFDEIGCRIGRSPEAVRKVVTRALRELSGRLGHLH